MGLYQNICGEYLAKRAKSKVVEPSIDVTKYYPGNATFLNVQFEEKEAAKKLGAKFDWKAKKWYVKAGRDLKPFQKWIK